MAQPQPSSIRNHLLAALPPDVLLQLLPALHRVSLIVRQTLAAPGQPIEAVYFVERGWVSMVAHLLRRRPTRCHVTDDGYKKLFIYSHVQPSCIW
jgi:hypothetical protein